MTDEQFLTLVDIIRRFELEQSELRPVQRRLAGKIRRRTPGSQFPLYRLTDVSTAVDEARQELAHRERWKHLEIVRPTSPCPGCGAPVPERWILDRCHTCMRQAA